MKILMIGNQDSGKTTYMASAYGVVRSGIEGFSLKTDQQTDAYYRKLYDNIREGRYPLASDKRTKHSFDLYYGQQSVLHFDWIDYNGGIINILDANQLMRDIDTADGLMLFFDAEALRANKASAHQMRRIISLLGERLSNADRDLLTVLLVVTKTDRLGSREDYEQAVRPLKAFSDSFEDNEHVYARVVPVSCTKKGLMNVDLPLLDVLDSGLSLSYFRMAVKAKSMLDRAAYLNENRNLLNWLASKLAGTKTNGEMAEIELRRVKEKAKILESLVEPQKRLKGYIRAYQIRMPMEG